MEISEFVNDLLRCLSVILVSLLGSVTSQCSEAHRQTCSLSYTQLQEISFRVSPATGRYVPDYNETTLRHVCSLYTEYTNCSQPFLTSCKQHFVQELQTYDSTFGQICGPLFHDYLLYRSCFQRLQLSQDTCQQKELKVVQNIDVSNVAYRSVLCSSARDYVSCIYTAVALGCSFQAADLYFKLLNHSISVLFSQHTHPCPVQHPTDTISIYTTSTSTSTSLGTTTSQHVQATSRHALETSGCSPLLVFDRRCNKAVSVVVYSILLYLCVT